LDSVVGLGCTDYPLAVAGQLAPVQFQVADAHGGRFHGTSVGRGACRASDTDVASL
jgi:hypothetical protein